MGIVITPRPQDRDRCRRTCVEWRRSKYLLSSEMEKLQIGAHRNKLPAGKTSFMAHTSIAQSIATVPPMLHTPSIMTNIAFPKCNTLVPKRSVQHMSLCGKRRRMHGAMRTVMQALIESVGRLQHAREEARVGVETGVEKECRGGTEGPSDENFGRSAGAVVYEEAGVV